MSFQLSVIKKKTLVLYEDYNEIEDFAGKKMSSTAIVNKTEGVSETSKRNKMNHGISTSAQEEDDLELDKILAEIDQGPPISKLSPAPPLSSLDASAEGEKEDESNESAAAKEKKKKKKKEREKRKKAEFLLEPRKDVTEKKVPKHVRDMQEALARRIEEEERRKRVEDERFRKEEEERLRQEELERQAEEAKRMKKEREKEKLLRKKLEGRLLTGKQKEQRRRLEAMRNQILLASAAAKGLPLPQFTSGPAKRPKYQTKKTRPRPGHHLANANATAQAEHIQEKDVSKTKSVESIEAIEEDNGIEGAEDWDANFLDDAVIDLSLKSASADVEVVESELEIGVKNDPKNSAPNLQDGYEGAKPTKSPDIDSKKNQDVVEIEDKDKRIEENLRSPICCVLGHVDAGKTKLLDCIRGTNVQGGEARGITQQIGATYIPVENICERTKGLKAAAKLKVPGLIVIDTPGHESFTNLRSRGSGLCDIAILVVDIMCGLEQQTIESLNLLRRRKTQFIVALNKVDRLYGWKTIRNAPILETWKQQSKDVLNEFNIRLSQVIFQFKEQGLNTVLYYENKDMGKNWESWETFNIVPTSAITGEGIPDLLLLLVLWAQKTLTKKLMYRDEVQCTVLEVKVVEGHGTTIDVILVNGILHEGDQVVVCGLQGPIVTKIRGLLTPHPMKELRVKGTYLRHKEIKGAQGIKITGQGLTHAISGTGLYVVGPEADLDNIKESVMEDMKSVFSRIDKSDVGVCVQASTIGSLEVLLDFLKSPAVNVPVIGISIGPVQQKDVKKASVLLEKEKGYAVILAFDVKVTPKAQKIAKEMGVKVFISDIIHHLFGQFKAYIDNLKEEKKKEAAKEAVFPCVLKILPDFIFNKKDPIILGVDVIEGIAKVGTPLCCIPQSKFIDIGCIASIENNHKSVDYAKKGQKVAIKITGNSPEEQQKTYGEHFDLDDELVSRISKKSFNILKTYYEDDLSIDEWRLLAKLKKLFRIL